MTRLRWLAPFALMLSCIAATAGRTGFHYSTRLGSTNATVSAWAQSTPNYSFRLGGTLVVRDGSRTLLSADPWKLAGLKDDTSVGSAISLDGISFARLSDAPYPELLISLTGCGANCSGATTVLSYVSTAQTYRPVSNAYDYFGQLADVVTIGGRQYVNATLQSPWFECHACGNGTTPLLVRVRNFVLADDMSAFPDRLRADARQAWSDYQHGIANGGDANNDQPPLEDALFRYFADEVRLGNRSTAVARLRASPSLHGKFDSFLSQSNERLREGGIAG